MTFLSSIWHLSKSLQRIAVYKKNQKQFALAGYHSSLCVQNFISTTDSKLTATHQNSLCKLIVRRSRTADSKVGNSTCKMYKQSGTNLLEQPEEKVKEWLNSFDAVIADCDGVLWLFNNVIKGSDVAMNRFKEIGKKIFFCTNNSTKSREELVEKAVNMGFNITENEIISTAHSTAQFLKNRGFDRRVYVIGSSGITKELDAVGIGHTPIGPDPMQGSLPQYLSQHFMQEPNIGAVIVGFDEHFSFPKMTKAASHLSDPDVLFIATNTDERFPMPNLVIPGTGSFVRCVQTCAERDPLVIGKPNKSICEHLILDGTIKPERTLMIGDRCNTDVLLGYNCGFQTLLVGTGIHHLNDVETWKQSDDPELRKLVPDVFLPRLGDILPFIESS